MTNNQIAWARTHDWFIASVGNGVVQVLEAWRNQDGSLGEAYVTFSDFRALRAWAGY